MKQQLLESCLLDCYKTLKFLDEHINSHSTVEDNFDWADLTEARDVIRKQREEIECLLKLSPTMNPDLFLTSDSPIP